MKHKKFLRYVLIVLLMIAPMRSVMAEQFLPCDMDEMPLMMSDAATHQDHLPQSHLLQSQLSQSQSEFYAVELNTVKIEQLQQDQLQQDQVQQDQLQHSQLQHNQLPHDCCCCDDNNCVNDCDMSTTTSLLLQVSTYRPVISSVEFAAIFSTAILARSLSPPTPPPLKLL